MIHITSGYRFAARNRGRSAQASRKAFAKPLFANALKRLLRLIGAVPHEMVNVTGHSTRRTGTMIRGIVSQ